MIPTVSYRNIQNDYLLAIEWMKSLGIRISSGRTKHYAKVIRQWEISHSEETIEDVENTFSEFVYSMLEVHNFISIYKSFKDVDPSLLNGIIFKLQKGVSGPIKSYQETHVTTTSRNFLFEALLAARLHFPSRDVATIFHAVSDTGVFIEDYQLWIECKRISSPQKIEANVKKASIQLEKILNKKRGTRHRGLVALDLSKIIQTGDKIFISDSDPHLLDSVDNIMNSLIAKFSHIWEGIYKRRSRRIIGTILYFHFMSTSEERNLLVYTSQWGINPRLGISDKDLYLVRNLASKLKEST